MLAPPKIANAHHFQRHLFLRPSSRSTPQLCRHTGCLTPAPRRRQGDVAPPCGQAGRRDGRLGTTTIPQGPQRLRRSSRSNALHGAGTPVVERHKARLGLGLRTRATRPTEAARRHPAPAERQQATLWGTSRCGAASLEHCHNRSSRHHMCNCRQRLQVLKSDTTRTKRVRSTAASSITRQWSNSGRQDGPFLSWVFERCRAPVTRKQRAGAKVNWVLLSVRCAGLQPVFGTGSRQSRAGSARPMRIAVRLRAANAEHISAHDTTNLWGAPHKLRGIVMLRTGRNSARPCPPSFVGTSLPPHTALRAI